MKLKKEKSETAKEHKAAVKFWKKELGDETKKNIKHVDRLNSFENLNDTPSPFVLPPISQKDSSNTATVLHCCNPYG